MWCRLEQSDESAIVGPKPARHSTRCRNIPTIKSPLKGPWIIKQIWLTGTNFDRCLCRSCPTEWVDIASFRFPLRPSLFALSSGKCYWPCFAMRKLREERRWRNARNIKCEPSRQFVVKRVVTECVTHCHWLYVNNQEGITSIIYIVNNILITFHESTQI